MSRDDSNFLATMKFSVFFEVTLDKLAKLILDKDPAVKRDEFSWLWDYFAEPKDNRVLDEFWESVIDDAEEILHKECFNGKKNIYCKITCGMRLIH